MPAQRKYPVELRERATRMAVDARRDPASRTGAYRRIGERSRPESARAVSDREQGGKIESIHAENYGVYGARKVHKELGRQDIPAAHCTVERLMRAKGLRGISRAKGPRTTKRCSHLSIGQTFRKTRG